jgi:hypothetical protein
MVSTESFSSKAASVTGIWLFILITSAYAMVTIIRRYSCKGKEKISRFKKAAA